MYYKQMEETDMELTAKAVHDILKDCLYDDNEVSNGAPPDDAV